MFYRVVRISFKANVVSNWSNHNILAPFDYSSSSLQWKIHIGNSSPSLSHLIRLLSDLCSHSLLYNHWDWTLKLSSVILEKKTLLHIQYVQCKNVQTGGKHIFHTNYMIIMILHIWTCSNLIYCPQYFGCYGNNFHPATAKLAIFWQNFRL